ncbi:hypothetical protein [Micromonospora sp. NPDC050495]|uniref:hypothetical protein n=1 Tax=Micromonospora sp. NPDC050495 TaxID=3154936 RepID=UPI00340DAA48
MESRVSVGVDTGRAGAGHHETAAGPIRRPEAGGVCGRSGRGSPLSRPLRRAFRATYRRSRCRLRRLLRALSGRARLSGPALGALLRPVGDRMRRWARSVVGGGRPPGARTVRRVLVDSLGDAVAVVAALLQASQGVR